MRRLVVGGACGLLLAGLAVACAEPGDPPTAARPAAPTAGSAGAPGAGSTAGPTPAPTAGPLDVHRPGDLGFYESFNVDGADRAVRFHDLDEGARASTAVVVGKVVDVVLTLRDARSVVGVVLRPTDVVAGALPPASAARLTIELVGDGATDDEQIAKLRRRLPAQPGLWFLRGVGDVFRPVSPQGLFVQGSARVETPLTSDGDGDMAAEGRGYRRLSGLVRHVRGVR